MVEDVALRHAQGVVSRVVQCVYTWRQAWKFGMYSRRRAVHATQRSARTKKCAWPPTYEREREHARAVGEILALRARDYAAPPLRTSLSPRLRYCTWDIGRVSFRPRSERSRPSPVPRSFALKHRGQTSKSQI